MKNLLDWFTTFLMQLFTGQWVCSQCGKRYKWQGNLKTHQKVECGKEPSLLCSFCPYRTPHKSNLKRHMGVKHSSVVLDDLLDSFITSASDGVNPQNAASAQNARGADTNPHHPYPY